MRGFHFAVEFISTCSYSGVSECIDVITHVFVISYVVYNDSNE
jgi:hypothetical protein